jgi:hypothetical protein
MNDLPGAWFGVMLLLSVALIAFAIGTAIFKVLT